MSEAEEDLAAGAELIARFAAAGYTVTVTEGGNAVLEMPDAFTLLNLAELEAASYESVREQPCRQCGKWFAPGSRAWALVWDGGGHWLQVRYVLTMPIGPFHTGCVGTEQKRRQAAVMDFGADPWDRP